MTTTTEAARQADVTPRTIRAWARMGAVAAVKVSGRWVVDTDSLRHRIAVGRRRVNAQLAQFRDADSARTKALELIEQGAIIPGSRSGLYFAVSTDASHTYFVDAAEGSCTCKGHVYSNRCYHAVAAAMLETGAYARTARLALAA
jgi:hypothetical protein